MRRIIRAEAICLRVQDYKESSKLVTLLTPDHGRVSGLAKGARRPRSKFGAALDVFARLRVIYHWHESGSLYTISDAELLRAHSGIAQLPGRYVAAEQLAEFALRTAHPQDPNPQLFNLLAVYLDTLEGTETGFAALVCSFLLKAASFAGFRPELRRCLRCRRPLAGKAAVIFDPRHGGVICSGCAGDSAAGARLTPGELAVLDRLLYTPVESLAGSAAPPDNLLPLVLDFLKDHFEPLVLHSFRRLETLG
jgi:DNA repair protein RecO (recombination protein O)